MKPYYFITLLLIYYMVEYSHEKEETYNYNASFIKNFVSRYFFKKIKVKPNINCLSSTLIILMSSL
jgi:hypothetical protein